MFLLVSHLAQGHHGWANFDRTKEVTLKGIVTEFHWTNPHCVIEFEVKDENGKGVKWEAEMSGLAALARKGWTAASIEAGNTLIITGNPTLNHAHSLWLTKLIVNGKVLIEGSY
jgi:hypothetical protein